MTRLAVALLGLLLPLEVFAIEPEACLVGPGEEAVTSVEYDGRVFELAVAECRELFLSDPERYAQLFDALAELRADASTAPRADHVSLVPN